MLNACANIGTRATLQIGTRVHSIATSSDWNQPTLVNALMTMYIKCGEPEKVVQMWKQQLQDSKVMAIEMYTSLLSACSKIGPSALRDGIQIQSEVTKSTLHPDELYHAALVNMYTKCGQPDTALSLWEAIQSDYDGVYDKCL